MRGTSLSRRVPLLALVCAASLSGCAVFGDDGPVEARLRVEGPEGAAVRVLTSTSFVATLSAPEVTRVSLLEESLAVETLPLDRTFDIESSQRFFVEVARADEDISLLRMRVSIDGDTRLDVSGPLLRTAPLRWVFVFNQFTTETIEVR